MVNYPHNKLFNRGDTERQIKITFSGGTITNKEMHHGSFSLTESLCSEESLRFGTCEASVLQFKVHNVLTPLVGQKLTVYEVLNGNTAEPFNYGKYKVQSDKPTADRKYRDVVAYDAMYDILNADVASWYNSLTFPCTIGYFRKQFLKHLGIEYVDTELVNDGIYIQKTIDVEELSGKQVSNAICEINGCFGHINRQGKFQYVTLKQHEDGLYPGETLYPSETLYPKDPVNEETFYNGNYSSCEYQDFETKVITGIRIRQEEDDVGATVGTNQNLYVIQGNFLVYGKNNAELEQIANNILSVVSKISYVPLVSLITNGKPYIEVGDRIMIATKERAVDTYVLERTITAVKGQKDDLSARGTEYYPKELNSLNKQITQIKGRYNKLSRTVDETRSEIGNLETKTETRFIQTDNAILAEAKRASEAESSLRVTADQIQANVNTVRYDLNNNYYTITESDTKISASSDNILLSVSKTYETISNAGKKYNSLQSQIDVNESNISLKVSSDEVQNMIDVSLENITLTANQINLDGYTRINGFSIDENGHARLRDGTAECYLSGNVLVVAQDGKYSYLSIFGLETDSVNTGAISCSSLVIGEYDAIHTGNISSYIPSTSGFVTDDELSTALGAFVPRTELITTLESYPTYTALNNVLAEKGYATESWVNNKGYITSSYLYGYATEDWVTNKLSGYMTDSEFEFWENNTLDYKLGDLEDMYNQLEERISALEASI